jgi:hypothetical protein
VAFASVAARLRTVPWRRVVTIVLVLVGLVGVVFAFSLVDTGENDNEVVVNDTGPIEQLIPARDDEILRQEPVGVDLNPGWTGILQVNGVEIPEDQLDIEPALGQVLFLPAAGKAVERFEAGENCVTAVVWRVEETRADARNVDWCFNVT